MSDCPFCLISRGDEEAEIVYSDETVVAFLDANPIRPGHTLVVPREHIRSFYELDDHVASALWSTVNQIARQIAERLHPEHVGLLAAGWDVPHTHIHVIPMLDYHDITSKRMLNGQVVPATGEELARRAAVLRGRPLGVGVPVVSTDANDLTRRAGREIPVESDGHLETTFSLLSTTATSSR